MKVCLEIFHVSDSCFVHSITVKRKTEEEEEEEGGGVLLVWLLIKRALHPTIPTPDRILSVETLFNIC
ncbi:hypothetical protein J6590_008072 [Homalodisca vitripennis]|nr:hypothetical protein J6590_008072 [Homalodisca vitripennis]